MCFEKGVGRRLHDVRRLSRRLLLGLRVDI